MLIVVIGPPAAGKSTWVREHAEPSDIVIDFDALAVALGSPVEHGHAEQHAKVARAVWLTAKEQARRARRCDVWLIHANPSDQSLAIYRRQGARVVTIDPGEAVVRSRLVEGDGRNLEDVAAWYRRGRW